MAAQISATVIVVLNHTGNLFSAAEYVNRNELGDFVLHLHAVSPYATQIVFRMEARIRNELIKQGII